MAQARTRGPDPYAPRGTSLRDPPDVPIAPHPMPPFFSVIVPTFNRAALLREAINSIARQTFRDFELFVVDDGSSDETEAVVTSCGLPIRFLRQENRGPGAARNLALHHAQGHYVAFLDSDDQWLPWTLDTYHRIITTRNLPAFMSGVAIPLDDSFPIPAVDSGALEIRAFPHLLAACSDRVPPVGGTPSICLDRLALADVGGFVSQRMSGEDTDLWLRLGLKPGFIRILSPPVFRQRKHSGNVTNQLDPSIAGGRYLMRQERTSAFPGGKAPAETASHYLRHGSQPYPRMSPGRQTPRGLLSLPVHLRVEPRPGQSKIPGRLSLARPSLLCPGRPRFPLMRFHGLMVIRDEDDIIAQSLAHLLSWIDAVYVLDMGSTDATWEIVNDIARTDRRVVPFKSCPYRFDDSIRGYIFEAFRARFRDGDWVVRTDADEIYHADPRLFLKERVQKHETCVYLAWVLLPLDDQRG